MSLNGLDEAKVVEAHETAASEPGGWYGMQPPLRCRNICFPLQLNAWLTRRALVRFA